MSVAELFLFGGDTNARDAQFNAGCGSTIECVDAMILLIMLDKYATSCISKDRQIKFNTFP